MGDLVLEKEPFLGGYDKEFAGTRLWEVTDMTLRSLAVPLGGDKKAAAAIKATLGVEVPAPAMSATNGAGTLRIFASTADQFMVIAPEGTDFAGLDAAVYQTDQSDTWAVLSIEGANCRAALERLCPLDLHPEAFAVGAASRTMMEHMGTIIIRTDHDQFLLMVSSSFAGSFLHAVEISLEYTT